jgi:hypothetical protein
MKKDFKGLKVYIYDSQNQNLDQYQFLTLAVSYVPIFSIAVRGYMCHLNESWVLGFEIRVWSCRGQNGCLAAGPSPLHLEVCY